MEPGTEPSGIAKSLAISPRIKTPVQLAAFIAGVLTICVAGVLAKNAPFHAVGIAGMGILFIAYGQAFAQTDKLPEHSRVRFLLTSLVLFVFAFALCLTSAGFLIWNATRKSPGTQSAFSPAGQKMVDLVSEMDKIRPIYMSLKEHPERALEVNKQARHLAERMFAVQDSFLGPGLRIYKYESIAYSWAMVLGSENDNGAKSKTINKILEATEKGNALVDEAMHAPLDDKKALDLQDWIIKDNTWPRLKRLEAAALCSRWQINRDPDDREKVRKLVGEFPHDYLEEEKPQESEELLHCLNNNKI